MQQASEARAEVVMGLKRFYCNKKVPTTIASLMFCFPARLWEERGIFIAYDRATKGMAITSSTDRSDLRDAVNHWRGIVQRTKKNFVSSYEALFGLGEASIDNRSDLIRAAIEDCEAK